MLEDQEEKRNLTVMTWAQCMDAFIRKMLETLEWKMKTTKPLKFQPDELKKMKKVEKYKNSINKKNI